MNRINTKKIKKNLSKASLSSLLVIFFSSSQLEGGEEIAFSSLQLLHAGEEGHSINFSDVPVTEFIRFVSKIAEVNFIFDNKELQFNVTLASGKPVSSENVLKALIQMLRVHGFGVSREENYYVIHRGEKGGLTPLDNLSQPHLAQTNKSVSSKDNLLASIDMSLGDAFKDSYDFFVYKLQYHQGSEIEESIKKIAADLRNQPETSLKLLNAIQSMQWVKATNSLLCSADLETRDSLKKLISSLDVPLRQVFIEVLVIETDIKRASDFGLQWSAGGQYLNKVGFGTGNFPPNANNSFATTMQGINAQNTPTGLNQIPIGSGFDLGVIGDILMHKGKSYLSLGTLVSALQIDGDSTIVLNQKIITQDNKNSTIFVGDNIPFTGSVVQTVGQSQQTTANIEYRDIGVSLSITPRLGEGDVITLDLDEEITESLNDPMTSTNAVNGIRTTKTNMATHVHVPDRHFLVLSGMIRNAKSHHKSGIPCLGGLPVLGAAFSRTTERDEKRNVIIFVRPRIIQSMEDYKKVTESQEEVYELQSPPDEFRKALELLPQEE
jgi:type II secretory pathway component GspD/PulD (secretin)